MTRTAPRPVTCTTTRVLRDLEASLSLRLAGVRDRASADRMSSRITSLRREHSTDHSYTNLSPISITARIRQSCTMTAGVAHPLVHPIGMARRSIPKPSTGVRVLDSSFLVRATPHITTGTPTSVVISTAPTAGAAYAPQARHTPAVTRTMAILTPVGPHPLPTPRICGTSETEAVPAKTCRISYHRGKGRRP